jgi:Fic family protein
VKSFEHQVIVKQTINQELLKTIRELGEFRGKEALFRQQSPQTLDTLLQNAIIQSTESSNRIEGVTAETPERLKALLTSRAKPKDRSEQEIAGYRDVLKTIHANHDDIPFSYNIVLQFHRDLFKFTPSPGGVWKSTDNEISEKTADGKKSVRFKPIPAWKTKEAMGRLHSGFEASLNSPDAVEPLLAVGAYILDFLCIHPFMDGNGRMSRLLTLLLLYRFGYEVGRFISLERIVEDTKESYYDSLYKSSQGWHEGKHSLIPWWSYLLGVVLRTAYKEFEDRVGKLASARGAKGAIVLAAIEKLPTKFTISQLQAKCPTVGIDYIRKVLRSQRDSGKLKSTGRGPDAGWQKLIEE